MSKDGHGDLENDAHQAYVTQLLTHQDDLRAFIHSLLPNSSVADDVLQNTNLVLWEKRNQFKEGTHFHAWAFRIARIQVQHQYDRAKRETRLVFSESLIEQLANAAKTTLSRERKLTILESCMGKLSKKQRQIVNARYSPNESLEQYAKQTGATAGSLRISLYRIRAALRKCVEKNLAGQST